MSDPLSVAASAAGLVSLGLTVVGGIAQYADALKGRTEELRSVNRRNEMLQRTIILIDGIKSRFQQLPQQPQQSSLDNVNKSIKACKAELLTLKRLVVELNGCPDPHSWKDKLKNTGKKMSYAFDRSKLEQLAMTLDHTIQTLQLALQALGLDSSRLQLDKLETIETTSTETASDVKKLQSDFASLNVPIRSLLPAVLDGLDQMEGRLSTSIEAVQMDEREGRLLAQQEFKRELVGFESRMVTLLESRRAPLFNHLVSKPAAYREFIEEMSNFQIVATTDRNGSPEDKRLTTLSRHQICCCRRGRRIEKREIRFGLFGIYRETDGRPHQTYCPLSQAELTAEWSAKSGVRFYGLVRLMKVVLNVSFDRTFGSGGNSINLGVPANTYDISGMSPLGFVKPSDCVDDFRVVQILLEAQTDISPAWMRDVAIDHGLVNTKPVPLRSARLAEAYECGPLTMAILADDAPKVVDLITRYPKALQEENLMGHTPLHFAARKPHMLVLILSTADYCTLSKGDPDKHTLLDHALEASQDFCRNRLSDLVDHSDCHCLKSFDMILEAALEFPGTLLSRNLPFLCRDMARVCGERALSNYAKYMRKSCDRLILDTLQALERVGINSSAASLIPLPRAYEAGIIETMHESGTEDSSLADRWHTFQRLYDFYQEMELTEVLFSQGFTQVDAFADNKLPLIACSYELQFGQWLIDHGADPYRHLYKASDTSGTDIRVGVVSAHYASFFLGHKMSNRSAGKYKPGGEAFARYFRSLSSREFTDQCSCACSNTGCTQFVYLLKGFSAWFAGRYPRNKLMRCGNNGLDGVSNTPSMPYGCHSFCLKHPLRSGAEEVRWRPFPGDTIEIQDEEKVLLQELELHVEEFENKFRRICKANKIASPSSPRITPQRPQRTEVHADCESSDDGWETEDSEAESDREVTDPFKQFWVQYWNVRMEEIRDQIGKKKLSEEERRAAEASGVVWDR
ncbi:uncharacterized protein PG998_006438 [Apiospora kogelbergensis]|uniref:uncharacterized protein n=1 Tax=Apiospora kogelbergensis TaxID=1337665 RepID=UPI00312D272D